jgi:hypothetical protein
MKPLALRCVSLVVLPLSVPTQFDHGESDGEILPRYHSEHR